MPIEDFPFDIEFFDEPEGPEPTNIIAGDTLTWQRVSSKYPGAAGWVLSYVLNSLTARIVVNQGDITFAGDVNTIVIPSTETKTWKPGKYQWVAVMNLAAANGNPAQRFTVGLGRVIVAIDLLDSTSSQDTRSPNEQALSNLDDMLAGRGGDGVQEYTINGRMLRRYNMTELLQLRSFFASKVRQERADRGEVQPSRRVAVHFG